MLEELLLILGKNISDFDYIFKKYNIESEDMDGILFITILGMGVDVRCEESIVDCIYFYSEKYNEDAPYVGALPFGIRFSMTQENVRHMMGTPVLSREARHVPAIGLMPAFDRFDIDDKSYFIYFCENMNFIERITVSVLNRK